MKIKAKRLMVIKQLLSEQHIASQDELLSLLNKQKIKVTQATLSRDLKYLKVAKVPDALSGYKYVIPTDIIQRQEDENLYDDFPLSSVESIEFSGNMAVLKTRPGFANGVASVIDSHGPYEILGTIAGDDTILIISREGITKSDVVNALALFIPGLKEKVV